MYNLILQLIYYDDELGINRKKTQKTHKRLVQINVLEKKNR